MPILRALPSGYQAIIGERGVKLSGGQRQRLALARALLCDRPMLIIDDALSAIDVETEQQVLQGILSTLAGRRKRCCSSPTGSMSCAMPTGSSCSMQGRIVDEGRHEDLLANPFYRAMAEKQQNHA